MPSVILNGPAIRDGVHNVVLRDAVFHSPVERMPSETDYYRIDVGVREGEFTQWIGTWSQANQRVKAGEPTSALDVSSRGKRLKAKQILVLRVSSTGAPATLLGARVNFRLALVGGRDGTAKPLVATGDSSKDPVARTAIAALERQVNEGGLSEWEDAVDLLDPASLVVTGSFQGRIQYDSTTQISLRPYTGNWVDVDGQALSIGSAGTLLTTSDGILSSDGLVTSTLPSSGTLYYVYFGSPVDGLVSMRLSTTAPTAYLGAYYLGTATATRRWRFAGWARTNGSTQFVDSTTDRLVVNYYNRVRKPISLVPAYADDNSETTYTTTSTTWTAANGGTGATGSYISTGEDAVDIRAFAYVVNSGSNITRIGIGDNSGANCAAGTGHTGTTADAISCSFSTLPASGYRTVVLLVSVSGGTGTYSADFARNGSATDPVATALYATVAV